MTRVMLTCGFLLAAVCMQGCLFINTEEKVISPPGPAGPEDEVIREIDTVGQLAFADNEAAILKNIAQRQDLTPAAQVHLVDVTFKRLAFEEMKVDVLMALIENPTFTADARSAILERIDRLAFEGNKVKILQALGGR